MRISRIWDVRHVRSFIGERVTGIVTSGFCLRLSRHAMALQESLLMLFHRIEAVKEEHDKLDSNNKFLQKYIGDLMSTSKITSSSSRGRK